MADWNLFCEIYVFNHRVSLKIKKRRNGLDAAMLKGCLNFSKKLLTFNKLLKENIAMLLKAVVNYYNQLT